jgi:hypothetical protein
MSREFLKWLKSSKSHKTQKESSRNSKYPLLQQKTESVQKNSSWKTCRFDPLRNVKKLIQVFLHAEEQNNFYSINFRFFRATEKYEKSFHE